MTISWGVVAPTRPRLWGTDDPRELVDFAVAVEKLGYDSFWLGDSLATVVLEPLSTLAAVSAVTSRITLGTAALLPAFRRPVHLAHTIAAVDRLSAGRLILAVGAGFPNRSEVEYRMSETPWARRFDRLEDTVALCRQLWISDGATSFHGSVLDCAELTPTIRPHRPGGPPIWLAGFTPDALARTARSYDGWLPYPPDPADYATGLATIRSLAADPGSVTPALFATVLITDDDPRAALDAYCHATYERPVEFVEQIQFLAAGSAAEVNARLGAYIEAGARHIVLRVATSGLRDQLSQLARLREVIQSLG